MTPPPKGKQRLGGGYINSFAGRAPIKGADCLNCVQHFGALASIVEVLTGFLFLFEIVSEGSGLIIAMINGPGNILYMATFFS
ncbi:MAG: hypothetical protein CSYNP_03568 [Syntrophus sp. SKADARSKE-3]|nr:hypothetical protein [Syntrophus sp. SKADARSKE-3]